MSEPWPAIFTQYLERIPAQSMGMRYNGVYNTILSSVFSIDEDFLVAPQNSRETVDLTLEIILYHGNAPVMSVKIKGDADLQSSERRAFADTEIRERIAIMQQSVEVPVLYMISTMGARCNVYRHNVATQETFPQEILKSEVEDTAPVEWWCINISTLEGRLALTECFNEVRAMCGDTRARRSHGKATVALSSASSG
ncbi:hypothetical protein BGX20_001361 [Mortierella sp. AD010]|nr:hypothetical protein BGX20_001361 [Mortierella sp. AD010]